MSAPSITAISYSYETAALATGYSEALIQKAVRMGDLVLKYPKVDGRHLTKGVIMHAELMAWIESGREGRAS